MIETRDLTKMYGELYALNRLTLKLERGDVYGFIGPNGAGKTTTMRILATLLNPTWGEATVCGYSIYNNAKEIRRVMGYMPDFFGVYDDMKVIEYLEFFAAAYRIKGPERRRKCDQVLDLVDLGYKRDALVTSLSRGMTQRLGLARVLLHEPQVLLLDEPASGLDPRARIEMRGLLRELRSMGKTILVSSHILPELADICNKIGIIERGALLFDGDVQSAIRQVRQHTVYLVAVAEGRNAEARDQLEAHMDVHSVEAKDGMDHLRVTLSDNIHDGSFMAELLLKNGFKLKMLKEEEIDLEDVFMGITKGITN
jgi:ABC-2 type transport system ATP-binding protein